MGVSRACSLLVSGVHTGRGQGAWIRDLGFRGLEFRVCETSIQGWGTEFSIRASQIEFGN